MGESPIPFDVLGLDLHAVQKPELLHRRHGNSVYRIVESSRSYVVKQFGDSDHDVEVRAYGLLESLGVPTLPVYGKTEQAVLLEDLENSQEWRLATRDDIDQAKVGTAVADWYSALHNSTVGEGLSDFLEREDEVLNSDSIRDAGVKLGLANFQVWQLAAEHIDELKRALRSLPTVINYNDFHWSNLALSRHGPMEAIVFDYGMMGVVSRYADCRNVTGSLGVEAARTFWERYGLTDEREATLDAPLSTLTALHAASLREKFRSGRRQS